MNSRRYKIATNIILGVMLLLGLMTISSVVMILLSENNLEFQFDRAGMITFFDLYEIPFKLGAATIAVFALWLTLERINQTERQLEIISDNNLFNNYYKHFEQFNNFISKDRVIKIFLESTKIDSAIILLPIYKHYYGSYYKLFKSTISEHKIAKIYTLHQAIEQSILNVANTDLSRLTHLQIDPLLQYVETLMVEIITPVSAQQDHHIQKYLNGTGMELTAVVNEIEKYRKLNLLYESSSFYRSILAFDGIVYDKIEHFQINYQRYLDYLDLA